MLCILFYVIFPFRSFCSFCSLHCVLPPPRASMGHWPESLQLDLLSDVRGLTGQNSLRCRQTVSWAFPSVFILESLLPTTNRLPFLWPHQYLCTQFCTIPPLPRPTLQTVPEQHEESLGDVPFFMRTQPPTSPTNPGLHRFFLPFVLANVKAGFLLPSTTSDSLPPLQPIASSDSLPFLALDPGGG